MPFDDVLARLKSGLDRDAELAAMAQRPDWDANFEGSVWDSAGWVADVAGDLNGHVARQDPKSTLLRVETIRQVIARYEFVTSHGPAVDHTRAMDMKTGAEAALRDALEMLASIYPDPTEES